MSSALVGPAGGLVGPGGGLVGPGSSGTTVSGSFTADAVLLKTRSGSFTANAVIKRTQSGSFTADAYVFQPGTGFFNADAVLLATAFSDAFNRTVDQGLGNRWTWTDDDNDTRLATHASQARAYVDGVSANLNYKDPGNPSFESYAGLPYLTKGFLQFDFWVPDTTNPLEIDTVYGIVQFNDEYLAATSSGYGTAPSNGVEWVIGGWQHSTQLHFTPDPLTWYRVKFSLGLTGTDLAKVWKAADPEPGSWTNIGTSTGPYLAHPDRAYLDFYFTPDYEPGRITNVFFQTIESPWKFTGAISSDAVKLKTQSGSFTANATIVPVPFTGDAIVKRTQGAGIAFNQTGVGNRNVGWTTTGVITMNDSGLVAKAGNILLAAVSFDAFANTSSDVTLSGDTSWQRLQLDMVPNGDQALVTYWKRKLNNNTTETITLTSTTHPTDDNMAGVLIALPGYFKDLTVLGSRNVNIESLTHPTGTFDVPRDARVLYLFSEGTRGSVNFGFGANGWASPSSGMSFVVASPTNGIGGIPNFAAISAWIEIFLAGATGITRQVNFTSIFGTNEVTNVQYIALIPDNKTFTADAVIPNRRILMDAVLKQFGIIGKFIANAEIIHGGRITANAWFTGVHSFSARAILKRNQTPTITADATIQTRTQIATSAIIKKFGIRNTILMDASILLDASRTGSFTTDAWLIGTTSSFTADAQVSSPSTGSGSFTANAVVSQTYRQATITANAIVRTPNLGKFTCEAVIVLAHVAASFTANAFIQWHFTANAFIARKFTANAVISKPSWTFTASAVIQSFRQGTVFNFTADAIIGVKVFSADAVVKTTQNKVFWALSMISQSHSFSFSANAWFTGKFTANAWIGSVGGGLGSFSADATINSNVNVRYFPAGGGPPIDLGTGAPYEQPAKKVQIEIIVDGVDVTKDVVVNETEFTQTARQAPGTFTLTLFGVKNYVGGEEVVVNIDGYRQYGGIVLAVTQAFFFEDIAKPKTVLTGADFNVLLDHIIVYNARANADSAGDLIQIPDSPKGTTDKALLAKVESYIDPSWKKLLDFTSKVDSVGIPSTEEPFTFEWGQTLRQFIAGITQMTNAISWINPYYQVEYHSAGVTNAPYPIVENYAFEGGVGCRNLQLTNSVEQMINDAWVFGTLAKTVSGQMFYSHHTHEATRDRGFFQFMETRSDLHIPAHVSQRAGSIISRRSLPTKHATCTIFEKGLQAGNIVTIFSGTYEQGVNLILRSQRLYFLEIQTTNANGPYYGVPAFDLELRSDPEDPWNLYDMLPFENPDFTGIDFPPFRIKMPHPDFWQNTSPHAPVDICLDAPTTTLIFRDDFNRDEFGSSPALPGPCGPWRKLNQFGQDRFQDLAVPPPWCISGVLKGPFFQFSNANFSASVTASGSTVTFFIRAASQQFINGVSGTNFQDAQMTSPFTFSFVPLGFRIKRSVGVAELVVWPLDGAHDPAVLHIDLPFEQTLFPDSRLTMNGSDFDLDGLAVAAGGGGTGIIYNNASPYAVPGSITITPSNYLQLFGVSPENQRMQAHGAMFNENAYGYTVNVTPQNNVTGYESGSRVYSVVNSNSGDMPFAGWGIVNGYNLNSGICQIFSLKFTYRAYSLPINMKRVNYKGSVWWGKIAGPDVFIYPSYMQNYMPLDYEVAMIGGFYTGGSEYEFPPRFTIGAGSLISTMVTSSPTRTSYEKQFASDGSGEIFQIGLFVRGYDSLPAKFPTETPFNLYLNSEFHWDQQYWTVEWDDPETACGYSTGPLGESKYCEGDTPPVIISGWGQESKLVNDEGVFTPSLFPVYGTLSVYVQGKLLLPDVDFVPVTDVNRDLTGSYRLVNPGRIECVQLTYFTRTNIVGANPSTRGVTQTDVRADRNRLPDVRGLG